jgi:hypothetical protein
MRFHIVGATLMLVAGTYIPVAAQKPTDFIWARSWQSLVTVPAPITGWVNRTAIPNEYLEVNVARGTIHIEGGASDRIDWVVTQRLDSIMGMSESARNAFISGSVGTTTWADRFTLRVGTPSADTTIHARAELQLRVPRDLKLLHLNLHGAGDVVVDNFAGELTVTADSGYITGTNLSGSTILEAREGGVALDLSATPFQAGPISLLSHDGSITISFPPQPSVVLELNTNCGNINSALPLTDARPLPGAGRLPLQVGNSDLDCALRPKSLPALPGVSHLHGHASVTLGSGAVTLRAMALQGDINLTTNPAPASGQCAEIPELGKKPDGSPVLATVIGRVLAADGRTPMGGVRLQIQGTQSGTWSDPTGEYRLAFDPHLLAKCRKLYVVVDSPGYATQILTLMIGPRVRADDVVMRKH